MSELTNCLTLGGGALPPRPPMFIEMRRVWGQQPPGNRSENITKNQKLETQFSIFLVCCQPIRADGEVVLLTRFNEAAPGVAVKVVDQP